MNLVEVTAMLEWVSRHDNYLVVDELTVMAWNDVLYTDIDSNWAREYLVDYFRKAEPKRLSAGLINEAWLRNKERNKATQIDPASATPMPEWFRQSIKDIGRL
jgi:hypothetical protein